MNDRRHLDRVAKRLVESHRLVGPVVIVGHSAGAASGTWIATQLIDAGIEVSGLVYVDGNDSPNHLIERAWKDVAHIPIRAVMAPPNPCNRQGRLTSFLLARRPGSVLEVPGAGHGDIEMTGATIYRRACDDRSGPTQWAAVQDAVLACIGELLEAG